MWSDETPLTIFSYHMVYFVGISLLFVCIITLVVISILYEWSLESGFECFLMSRRAIYCSRQVCDI